jgi:hypothetical protein
MMEIYIYVYIYIYIHAYIYAYMHTYLLKCTYVCVYACCMFELCIRYASNKFHGLDQLRMMLGKPLLAEHLHFLP